MKFLLLSGNKAISKPWIYKVSDALELELFDTYVVEYDHWDIEDGTINLDLETQNIKKLVEEEKIDFIFAKSAGTVLASRVLSEGIISSEKVIFVGTPVKWAEKLSFPIKSWMSDIKSQVLFIHNENDPIADKESLISFIDAIKLSNYKLVEYPMSDHAYKNISDIVSEVTNFISK